jgi:hypothetical protein
MLLQNKNKKYLQIRLKTDLSSIVWSCTSQVMIIEAFTRLDFFFYHAWMCLVKTNQNFQLKKVPDYVVCKILLWKAEPDFVEVHIGTWRWGLRIRGPQESRNCNGDRYL